MTIIIIGDQSETQTCYGPFSTWAEAGEWAADRGIDESRVSYYDIVAPDAVEGDN